MDFVDTPFLTDLKTLMLSFMHSMIAHVCACYEFPKLSAERLVSGPFNSLLFGLFLDRTLVPLPGGRERPVGHFL